MSEHKLEKLRLCRTCQQKLLMTAAQIKIHQSTCTGGK